jgi:hypothetical protein
MRGRIPLAIVLAGACGAAPTAPLRNKPAVTRLHTVRIAAPGVFLEGRLLGTIARLRARPDVLVAALAEAPVAITCDLDAEPATLAIEALRLFTGRTVQFRAGRDGLTCATLRLHDTPSHTFDHSHDLVRISVFLDEERTFIGLSRLDEFQVIDDADGGRRDLRSLDRLLREHKANVFFADRSDLELAASDGSASDVAGAVAVACDAGFTDITLVAPDQLSAAPRP